MLTTFGKAYDNSYSKMALGHFVVGTFCHLTCNQILPSAQAMPGRSIIVCLIDVKFSCKAFWINIR